MNQYAAVNMFTQGILDRREAVWAPNSSIWMRVNYNRLNTDLVKETQHGNIDTNIVQIGGDLYQKNNLTMGIYGGYSHSKVDNQSKQTGTKGEGNVDGYHIGAYASWILQDTGKGPYIDTWLQYAWFNNDLKLQNTSNKSYNSSAWRTSIEAGYGFEISQNKLGRTWVLEPHAQVIYTKYQADSFRDYNQTRYSAPNASGFSTRIGARYYGMTLSHVVGVFPFIELNWLYKDNNDSIKLNNSRMYADMAKSVTELKVGVEGKLTQQLRIWSHIGAQKGNRGFERYEGQLGIGYKW